MQNKLHHIIVMIVVLILSGCGGSKPLVTEISSETISYDETVHIQNCGNKADSVQTASHSFSTKLEGTGTVKAGNEVVEGSVSATYGQYKNITRSQTLTAAPETNMEFILRWSEDVRAGNVTIDGESTKYTVHIPVSVEQISSRDLGCDTDISLLAGNWSGTAKSGDFEFDVRFEIGESCKIGSVCGTFDFPSISCSGTLTITKISVNIFEFQANDRTSGCNVSPEIKDSLQLLPDGTLLYVSTGNSYIETRGVLHKEK